MQLTASFENAYKLSSEAGAAIVQRVLRGMEQFNEYQFSTCRGWLQESAAQVREKATQSPLAAGFSPAFVVPSIERQWGYLQGVQKLTAELQHDLVSIVEEQHKVLSQQTTRAFQEARANPLPGSEAALATVESLMNATNQALEQATQITERITGMVAKNSAVAEKPATEPRRQSSRAA